MKRYFPWLVLLLVAAWIAADWRPPRVQQDSFDIAKFGKTPVLVGGRVKPLDTVARNALLIIHGKQQLRLEGSGQLTAMEWLSDTMFNASVADGYPVFVVQNADVLGLFGWEQSDRKYFSFSELSPFLQKIEEQVEESEKLESVKRSAYQNAILNLRNGLVLYIRLKNSVQPEDAQKFASELQIFENNLPVAGKATHQLQAGENYDKARLDDVAGMIPRYEKLSKMAYILAVPPVGPTGEWHSVGNSLSRLVENEEIHPIVKEYALIGDAYRARSWSAFNQHANVLETWFAREKLAATRRCSFESLFNRLQPFSQSMALYVLGFLLACGSWLGWSRTLNRSTFYVLLLALAVHTFGLVSRMYLQERPPVTNLYSSAIFIGWGRSDRIAHSRANLSRRHWSGVRRCNWVHYPDYCPSPCR
jgi:hypothetical protein